MIGDISYADVPQLEIQTRQLDATNLPIPNPKFLHNFPVPHRPPRNNVEYGRTVVNLSNSLCSITTAKTSSLRTISRAGTENSKHQYPLSPR